MLIRAEQKINEYKNESFNNYDDKTVRDYLEKIFDLEPANEKAKLLERALNEVKEEKVNIVLQQQQESVDYTNNIISLLFIVKDKGFCIGENYMQTTKSV